MSVLDIFRVGRFKQEAESAKREVEAIKAKLGDAAVMSIIEVTAAVEKAKQEAAEFQQKSESLRLSFNKLKEEMVLKEASEKEKAERRSQQETANLRGLVETTKSELETINQDIANRKRIIIELDDQILLQEYGIFTPKYVFTTVAEYKNKLDNIRKLQSDMIRNKTAYILAQTWTLNGSVAEGKRMMSDYSKLIVRAFNTECEDTIDRVKMHNQDSSRDRLIKSFDMLNKLGSRMNVSISSDFLKLKLDELDVAVDFQVKKQDDKEAQKQIREQAREEAKLQREVDAALETLAKEERHFRRAQKTMETQLAKATSQAEIDMLSGELASISSSLAELEIKRQDVDYRTKYASAGYVYVISNIGAFGPDIFKIGVTRRLEPLDRIDELGGASVPFDFDVHALIFSEDAYGLESALHRHFAKSRLNMVNGRKEFFRANLDEIESVLRQHFSKPVEMIKIAEAPAYRQSIRIKEASIPDAVLPAS